MFENETKTKTQNNNFSLWRIFLGALVDGKAMAKEVNEALELNKK